MTRTRTLLLLVSVLLTPATVLAQDGGVDLDLGVKVGVNFATLTAPNESPDRRTGFIGGGHLTISLANSMFYFQPELLYSMKGFTGELDGGISATFALNYVDVPFLVGLHFDTGDSVTPRIFAGPQASILASCNVKGSEGGVSASIDCDADEFFGVLDTSSVLFDLLFGAGVDFHLGNIDIVFDARYDLGLTDALEIGDSKMKAWQFLVGVAFPLGS